MKREPTCRCWYEEYPGQGYTKISLAQKVRIGEFFDPKHGFLYPPAPSYRPSEQVW